jgi:hypothetical protein
MFAVNRLFRRFVGRALLGVCICVFRIATAPVLRAVVNRLRYRWRRYVIDAFPAVLVS